MAILVRNRRNETVTLAEQPLARGGEAEVYAVPSVPNAVVKLYHKDVVKKRGSELQAKIDAITMDEKLASLKQHENLAWPLFSVFDEQGHWVGYAMRKAQGVPMTKLAHAKAYVEHFPNLDRVRLLNYAINLLETIQTLHDLGLRIGDYNPANFLCDPQSSKVMLIDCDSWQVSAKGKTFHCPVTVPDMLAPELQGKRLVEVSRSLESEYFALAILLFKLLMLGRHPFDVVGGASPVENIQRGYFPYGLGAGGIPKGPWYNIWSHLSFKIKAAFVQTFKEGGANPAKRVSVKDWLELLKIYKTEMETKGWHNREIRPAEPKSREYRGRQSIEAIPVSRSQP